MNTQTAGRSDQGRRKNNEDFIAYFEPTDSAELKNYGSLYVVADGVGGAAKGERASQYAAQKLVFDYYQTYHPDPDQPGLIEPLGYLRSILKQVNEEIHEYAAQHDTRMATTIVAAVVREGFLYVANVGDSRAYLIRNGGATQINRDHSFVGEMVDQGEMTEAEAMASSIKNRLTRSLGGDPDVAVETYEPLRLQSGDKILLCSDGLTRYALKEDVASMMAIGEPEDLAERFIKYANDKGGADNISVIVVFYQPSLTSESPAIPIIRPKDVDLDTLQPTLPSYKANRGKKNRKREMDFLSVLNERKWQAAIVMLLLVLFLALAVAAGLAAFSVTKENLETPSLASVPPLATEPPVAQQEAPPAAPPQQQAPPEPTQTPSLAPTETNSPTATNVDLVVATNECAQNANGLVYILDDPNNGKGIGSIELHNAFAVTGLAKGRAHGASDVWLKVRTADSVIGWVWYSGCIKIPPGVSLNVDMLQFETPISIFTVTATKTPLK
ncbi:MAG: protein phosphatase 2C domain-containing protein [Anaerolineales bacterium]|nr:protein phosphatase 2C domain-containing protein [Anaerolineales bacterium]